jgi:hypothetical protein
VAVKRFRLISSLFISTLSINSAMALPIDWTGVFGVDTHMINNTCHTGDDVTKDLTARNGTQGITGDCNANFQTYVFKLNPQIIVNDGVTLKGEFSSGYLRGGIAGDNATNNQDGSNSGNNSYFFTSAAQRSGLNVNQMYMELYADTALVKIGRMSKQYGLGIVYDAGNDPWDRFFSMYDGIEAEMKIGNFSLIPYYAKISSYADNTAANGSVGGQASGSFDVRELGMTAKYDNKNRDLLVSILYAKRSSETKNSLYNANTQDGTANATPRGKTEVTIIEPFISKKWNKLKVAFEASLQTGEYGDVYKDNSGKSKLAANAYILEAKYELNPKWDIGFTGGQVSGDDGDSGKFEAAYLHPNYQIADLMFKYNYAAFTEGRKSIFDSSITNARFYKIHGHYKTDKWVWKSALIMANAMETADAGKRAYHHEESYSFNSTKKQDKNLGFELDFGFDYKWNPNVTISGYYGYWKLGDYFAYTNDTEELSLKNVHGGGLRATLEF